MRSSTVCTNFVGRATRKKLGDKWGSYRSLGNSWDLGVGCLRDVAMAKKKGNWDSPGKWRERFTIEKWTDLSEKLKIICLTEQWSGHKDKMPRHLLMNTASWYPLHLSSTLPHSTSPSPFLALSYFCKDFPCITYPYLIDSRGQNDFHLGNSGRQNHCIPPRRGPKCPRCYFSVSLNCSTHYYSSKSISTSEFQWQQKQYSEENGSVQCSSSINQSPQQRGWWCKADIQRTCKTPAKLWLALRKRCSDHKLTEKYHLAPAISLRKEFETH